MLNSIEGHQQTRAVEDTRVRFVDIRSAVKEASRVLHRRHATKSSPTGLPTGFVVLDELLDGLQPKYLYVVGSRPSMGRTTFALNIVRHLTAEVGKRGVVFSLVDSATSLAFRFLAATARIKTNHLRTGELDSDEWARLSEASSTLTDANRIFLNDSQTLSLADLSETAQHLKMEHSIDLIVVDGLEGLRIPGRSAHGTAEIIEIVQRLKALAEELCVPVLATTKLSLSVEKREDHRPTMMDFHEPSAIDQYADVVLFIYRDDLYNEVAESERGLAEIIIGRNREGEKSSMMLSFQSDYLRFEEQ